MSDVSSQNSIWQLRDSVRGTLPSGEFVVAFAALLFLRWADFEEAEREAIAAFDDVDYQPVLPSQFHWRTWCNCKDPALLHSLLQDLPAILDRYGNLRHDTMATHLHRVAPAVEMLAKFPAEPLANLVRWLADQPFETPKDQLALRGVLDTLLQNTKGQYISQHYTPIEIVAMMIALAQPKRGESIYDPCFGSAGLLTGALDLVQRHSIPLGDSRFEPAKLPLDLAGVELKSNTFVIGLTRMVLSGVNDPQLELGSALERSPLSNPLTEGYDIVLANPPWGAKVNLSAMDQYPIPSNDSSALFLQHIVSQLRPGGRAVMVVPPSLLFRSGRGQKLREWLLHENTVEAIVSIPRGAFTPHTSIETCMLLFHRGGSTKSVRMVNAESIFEKAKKSDFAAAPFVMAGQLSSHVRTAKPGAEWWDVDIKKIAEADYDLTPKRRDHSGLNSILDSLPPETELKSLQDCCTIRTGRGVKSDDLQKAKPQIQSAQKIENDGELLSVEEIEFRMQQLKIAAGSIGASGKDSDASGQDASKKIEIAIELQELENQKLLHESLLTENRAPVAYIRIKDIRDGVATSGSGWLTPLAGVAVDPKRKLRAGDILLSKSGTIGKAGIVRNGAVGAVAASGIYILRATEGVVDPHYLLAYLQSAEATAWLEDRTRGSAVRHLSIKVVKELPVAVPPLQIQHRIAAKHKSFSIDALEFLSELVGETQDSPVAAALNDWVNRCHQLVLEGGAIMADSPTTSGIKTIEQIAAIDCPLNRCAKCGKPYFLDTESSLGQKSNWSDGILTTCLSCRTKSGTNDDSIKTFSEQSPIAAWAIYFRTAIASLRNIGKVPDAASVLNILRSAELNLNGIEDFINGHLPNEDRARSFSTKLRTLLGEQSDRLLADSKIIVSAVNAKIAEMGDVRFELNVKNDGSLPVRDLELTIQPVTLKSERSLVFPFLSAGEEATVLFRGEFPEDRFEEKQVEIQWTGQTLDANQFSGNTELTLVAEKESETVTDLTEPLGGSPYVTGKPLTTKRNDVFFGRDGILEDIRELTLASGNIILLEGNRRAGKSSILRHLEGTVEIPGWICAYCTLTEAEGANSTNCKGVATTEVFRTIAHQIASSIRTVLGSVLLPNGSVQESGAGLSELVRPAIKDDSPFTCFREYFDALLDWLAERDLRLVMMIDEFDLMQLGIQNGITSPQVPDNLRAFLQSSNRVTAIFGETKLMKRIRAEYYSALYGLGSTRNVSTLSREHAEQLIKRPVAGRLAFSKPAVDQIFYLTGGQPYLIQCICENIFRGARKSKQRSITLEHVEAAAEELVRNNAHFNELFTFFAGSDRRRMILTLCHRESEGSVPLRMPVINEKMTSLGVDIREDALVEDLQWLTDLELLKFSGRSGGDSYSLTIPLMGYWIDTRPYDEILSKAKSESEDNSDE